MENLKSGSCCRRLEVIAHGKACMHFDHRMRTSTTVVSRRCRLLTAVPVRFGFSTARSIAREYKSVRRHVWPFDQAWDTSLVQGIDTQTIASNLFATSIFPYAGFLYCLQKSKKAPGLMLFGFYFLLLFVGATIPAGIYAKTHYNTILANVDWLHGTAESFLTITNLFIVLGLRQGIRQAELQKQEALLTDVPEVDSVQREEADTTKRQ